MSAFAAIFMAEVRFNLLRPATYVLMAVFAANAWLWWGWGPAVTRGWAVNSDFYIVWLYGGLSFMTMPLFVAVMMSDPVSRDARFEVEALIRAKPVGNAAYVLGKFAGNFAVLTGCLACFALTATALQGFGRNGVITFAPRFAPYLLHFVFFVLASCLALSALFFAIGAITRNVKIVYVVGVAFYPLFIAWQLTIRGLPLRWRVALDPLLFNFAGELWKLHSADQLNHLAIIYSPEMIANRGALLVFSAVCLGFVCWRIAGERTNDDPGHTREISILSLPSLEPAGLGSERPLVWQDLGWHRHFGQFIAVLRAEAQLLWSERSLLVVMPLALLGCCIELAARAPAGQAASAIYASRPANTLLLFLFALAVFYLGEALHRDREFKFEPIVRSSSTPGWITLSARSSVILLLASALVFLIALLAMTMQLIRGDGSVVAEPYLIVNLVILLPGAIFMIAWSVFTNVLARDKYLAYIVNLTAGGLVYYFAGAGPANWIYNPVLYRLWTPADLSFGSERFIFFLLHRMYCLGLIAVFLFLALRLYGRRPVT